VSPFVSTSNRPCEFQKRNQDFFRAYKETRSMAMRIDPPVFVWEQRSDDGGPALATTES
jgi:hypothetical protein